MLKPQSIREDNVTVYVNHAKKAAKKHELITLSEQWSDAETDLFKRLLKQGGYAEIKGVKYRLVIAY
jgi:hypothetical protein